MSTKTELDDFTKAYVECALWASMDESDENGGRPMDENYFIEDIAPEALESMIEDCQLFQASQAELLEVWYADAHETIAHAGHDFWLTRNRHGAGFWDRWNNAIPQGKIGMRLTEAAHAYGECDLYIGDDGRVYLQCG